MNGPPRRALGAGVAAAVAAAVIAGLVAVGGPGTARLEKLDGRRIRDLTELLHRIERYRAGEGHLPETLEALAASPGPPSTRDPASGEPYGYEVLDDRRFRLCAALAVPESAAEVAAGPIRLAESRRIARVVPDPEGGRLCWEGGDTPD